MEKGGEAENEARDRRSLGRSQSQAAVAEPCRGPWLRLSSPAPHAPARCVQCAPTREPWSRSSQNMLCYHHFYGQSAPDHDCHCQPDPEPIFIHDPRKPSFPPLAPSPVPTIINCYLFHAAHVAVPLTIKMPSGESCHDPAVRPAPAHAPAPRDAPHAPSHSPFQRIDLLHLNRDVLFAISNFCSVHDAVQFAMTCKDAYEIVMPRILADVTIGKADENQDEARDVPAPDDPSTRLEGPDRLEMFCNFMLADPKTRMRHLRALRLLDYAFARPSNTGFRDGWDADFSPADSLARLLHEATNLRILHIRDAEPLFQSHPSVYEALTELPALKELSLYYIGNFCLKTISQLRSRPAIIENGLWKDGPRPQGDVTPFGPYINSFQHIKLWECGCMLESVVDRFVWPNVHTLDIGGRIAKISELAHAFPNLRRLTFYLEFSVKQETGPAACWPELDYLETSAPIPSFPSPVRRLQLQYGIGAKYGSQHDLKTLPLMEKTNPVALSCTIAHTVPATMLERMRTSMPSLQYLELILNSGGRASMEWQAFQDWVVRVLRHASTRAPRSSSDLLP